MALTLSPRAAQGQGVPAAVPLLEEHLLQVRFNSDPTTRPGLSVFIAFQDGSGNFSSAAGEPPVSGRVTAVRNALGVVTGFRISFVQQVSPTQQRLFEGAIQRDSDFVFFAAGTYQRRDLLRAGPITYPVFSGPFPFSARAVPVVR